jgi:hypothetical protein
MQRNTANDESPLPMVRDLMAGFVQRTGLVADGEVTRYLWTDAFAVCNLLALFQRTDDEAFKKLALALIDQVHTVLGKHRADDPRSGWISGLSETDAVQHPTVAGLRIGKAHNERAADEPPDKRLEWGRDGQYFHYLTKWMHALAQAARSSGDVRYLQWALEDEHRSQPAAGRLDGAPRSAGCAGHLPGTADDDAAVGGAAPVA